MDKKNLFSTRWGGQAEKVESGVGGGWAVVEVVEVVEVDGGSFGDNLWPGFWFDFR